MTLNPKSFSAGRLLGVGKPRPVCEKWVLDRRPVKDTSHTPTSDTLNPKP